MYMVGLIGVGGSGKHVVGGILTALLNNLGFSVLMDSFAKPIKTEIRNSEGGIDKDRDRRVMQHLAIAMREQDPHYLVRHFIDRNGLNDRFSRSKNIDFLIAPDVRYRDEYDFCRENGVMILVEGCHRPLEGKEAGHVSEALAQSITREGVDYFIPKRRNLTETFRAVEELVAGGHYLKPATAAGISHGV